jgi:hypothetical protein
MPKHVIYGERPGKKRVVLIGETDHCKLARARCSSKVGAVNANTPCRFSDLLVSNDFSLLVDGCA